MKTKHSALILALALVHETSTLTAAEVVAFPSVPQGTVRTFTSLGTIHDSYSDDFAKKPGFGSSRILYLPTQDFFTLNGEGYRFGSPDLLGLEDEPIAYQRLAFENITMAVVSKKELRSRLQRRPLTAAEFSAVAELRAGKDLVTMPTPVELVTEHGTNRITGLLAVGALRAKAQCAECHQVKEGTLLGAFSYTLVPTNTTASAVLTLRGANTTQHQLNADLPRPTNMLDHLITDAPATRRPNGTVEN